jgi:hypothetical protein
MEVPNTQDKSTQEKRILRQNTNSPEDQRITKLVFDLLSTPWAKEMAASIKTKMEVFFDGAFKNIESPQKINDSYRSSLTELGIVTKSHIESGKENLDVLNDARGAIIVTNHFGLYKATMVENSNGRYPVKLDNISPFPVRMIALQKLADDSGIPIFETSVELPSPLLEIQQACNSVTIPIDGTGRTAKLTEDVDQKIKDVGKSMFVTYPEGGTSGKRNLGGPYDLDNFSSGAFVVAKELGLPIIPICQYFNPESGLELHILEPKHIEKSDPEGINGVMNEMKASMQNKLDQLQSK